LAPLDLGLRPLTPSWALSVGCGGQGRNAQTLLPLTVKQIMDAAQASDDKSNFAINGVEVSTVWILPLSAVHGRLVKLVSSDA